MHVMQPKQQQLQQYDMHHTTATSSLPPSPPWHQVDRRSTRAPSTTEHRGKKRRSLNPDNDSNPKSSSQDTHLGFHTHKPKKPKRLSLKQQGSASLKKSWDEMQAPAQRGTPSPVLNDISSADPHATNLFENVGETSSSQLRSTKTIAWLAKYGDEENDKAPEVMVPKVIVGMSLAERLKPRL